jgi:hypothetical protein
MNIEQKHIDQPLRTLFEKCESLPAQARLFFVQSIGIRLDLLF